MWVLSAHCLRLSRRRAVSRCLLSLARRLDSRPWTLRRCDPLHLPRICPSHSGRVGAFISTAPRLCAAHRRHSGLRHSRISLLLGVFFPRALRRPVWFDRGCALELSEHKTRPAAGSAINHDLPALRPQVRGNNADQRLRFLLRLSGLPRAPETAEGRLLRILQLRLSSLSAHSNSRDMLRLKSN